jgi:hypothetical protein
MGPAVAGRIGAWLRLSFKRQLALARILNFLTEWGWRCTRLQFGRAGRLVSGLVPALPHRRPRARDGDEPTNASTTPTRSRGGTRRLPAGTFWAHRWAYNTFHPQPYEGQVVLFTSEELAAEVPEPGRGWRQWASSVAEHLIPGNHGTCITRHRDTLTARLREWLGGLDGR